MKAHDAHNGAIHLEEERLRPAARRMDGAGKGRKIGGVCGVDDKQRVVPGRRAGQRPDLQDRARRAAEDAAAHVKDICAEGRHA